MRLSRVFNPGPNQENLSCLTLFSREMSGAGMRPRGLTAEMAGGEMRSRSLIGEMVAAGRCFPEEGGNNVFCSVFPPLVGL